MFEDSIFDHIDRLIFTGDITTDTISNFGYVGIDNIFNKKYAEYGVYAGGAGYFYPAPERHYYGGLTITL